MRGEGQNIRQTWETSGFADAAVSSSDANRLHGIGIMFRLYESPGGEGR